MYAIVGESMSMKTAMVLKHFNPRFDENYLQEIMRAEQYAREFLIIFSR